MSDLVYHLDSRKAEKGWADSPSDVGQEVHFLLPSMLLLIQKAYRYHNSLILDVGPVFNFRLPVCCCRRRKTQRRSWRRR